MKSPISLQVRASGATPSATRARLSVRLREETRLEHKSVEAACGLPGVIRNLTDYKRCLLDFYGIFCPIERHIATFDEWPQLELSMQRRARMPNLQQDLRQLDVDPIYWREAPADALPALPQFAFALGALYVLEGSSLGGQIIMSALQAQLHIPFHTASGFFAGRGEQTGPLWHEFREVLDAYGQDFPETVVDVIVGAKRTFNAIGLWFAENNGRYSS